MMRLYVASASFGLIGSLLLVLLGLTCFIIGLFTLIRKVRSRNWPVTIAEVISSTVTEKKESDGRLSHRVHIKYTYSVRGELYTSDDLNGYPNSYSMRESADDFLKDYPVGLQMEVFHNPNKPEDCLVSRNIGIKDILSTFLGLMFVVLGVYLYMNNL